MIDCDECGIFLQTAARRNGKALLGFRVRREGSCGADEKWTLIMGIDTFGRRFIFFQKIAGTSIPTFLSFVQSVTAQRCAAAVFSHERRSLSCIHVE